MESVQFFFKFLMSTYNTFLDENSREDVIVSRIIKKIKNQINNISRLNITNSKYTLFLCVYINKQLLLYSLRGL